MKRVSDPEIRRQQILETAMKLFYEKGYENTSMADIAKELNVVKGLCYRYFDSKQALFEVAMNEYAEECCQDFLKIIHAQNLPLNERLTAILVKMLEPKENGRYHDFFHKPGNEMMHEQIAIKMCKFMIPQLEEELKKSNLPEASAKVLAQYIMYGQIGIWQEGGESPEAIVGQFEAIINKLLNQ